MKKISTYWKAQLIGWAIFTIVIYLFDALIYHDSQTFMPFAISIFIFGLLVSHLLKISIKKLRILEKRFFIQVVSLISLTLLFCVIGTFIWMAIMIKLGYWGIEGDNRQQWVADFFDEYSFNLFPVLSTFFGWVLIYFLFHYVQGLRREAHLNLIYRIEKTEMEAKALRAQMNPHFIFNCLNSIKSLIQDDQKDKSVSYLTTFSKLIRTLFNNADKKEISLHDEIETCKLYLQLEAMRFDSKFSYDVSVDESIDLKSITVPALIIQPFIENAIWHGIVPKGSGGQVSLGVLRNNKNIEITIEDDGIGREASEQNNAASKIGHQSKGVNLTQSRLELDNQLQNRKAILEMIDKKTDQNQSIGTKVIIKFPEEH